MKRNALVCAALLGCGSSAALPPAPEIGQIQVVADKDGAVLHLPVVSGAKDYRAYLRPGATVTTDGDGRETVNGTVIYCAGQRQRNAPVPTPMEVMQDLEIAGLAGDTDVVVEAIDRLCPFAGVIGAQHLDIDAEWFEIEDAAKGVFSLFTADEIKAKYGSLIVNGHGPGPRAGTQAPPDPPKVLARSTITVHPLAVSARKTATFFDDFSNAADAFSLVATDLPGDGSRPSTNGTLWQNSKWSVYNWNSEPGATPFIQRGKLHLVEADIDQDVFASTMAVPRQVAHLSSTAYLHVTYEVNSLSTGRRYWWLSVCGAQTAGQTLDAGGKLVAAMVQEPFFYDPDGLNPSIAGWNCFQIFPRDGWPFDLPPSNTRPEGDIRVMVNKPGNLGRTSVVNVSPDQFHDSSIAPPDWYREQENGALVAPMFDQLMVLSPAQRIDVYLRRDRAVLYVDGRQKLCNDFAGVPLSMAEGAVGFGQVLYHSAAERLGMDVDFWVRTGQQYVIHNTPFVDERTWDNLGFDENVQPPASFDASKCYAFAG